MFFAVLKPFLTKEVKVTAVLFLSLLQLSHQDNIRFQATLKDLHGEVPAEVLPEEFGGETGKLDHGDCKEATELFEEYFKEVRQLGEDNKGRC